MTQADVWLSIGPDCRAVSYLREFGLTRFAAPSDWMIFKRPETLLHLYRTGFSDFLEEIEEYVPAGEGKFRFVRDIRYNVKCIHHFETALSLSAGQAYMKSRTLLRFRKTDDALKQAGSIGLVGSWSAPREELCAFLKGFAQQYPGREIVLHNVRHVPGEKQHWMTKTELSPLLTLLEYHFCDEGEDGEDAWKGNQYLWTQIIGRLCLGEAGRKRREEACAKP